MALLAVNSKPVIIYRVKSACQCDVCVHNGERCKLIIEDTVEPSFLSEKLTSTYTRTRSWPKLPGQPWELNQGPYTSNRPSSLNTVLSHKVRAMCAWHWLVFRQLTHWFLICEERLTVGDIWIQVQTSSYLITNGLIPGSIRGGISFLPAPVLQ